MLLLLLRSSAENTSSGLRRQSMGPERKMATTVLIVLSFSTPRVIGFGAGSFTTFRPVNSLRSHKKGISRLGSPFRRIRTSFLHVFEGDEYREITLPTEMVKESDYKLGIFVLMSVPLAWGTYVPVVRYLYEIQPPVPGLVFSACYYVLASVTLLALTLRSTSQETTKPTSPWPWQAGMELGLYLVIGNALQMFGLKTVPSDRAGFLVQLTSIMVPLVDATLTQNWRSISSRTWVACFIAFLGVVIMGSDGASNVVDIESQGDIFTLLSDMLRSLSDGDLLVVVSAFLYTLHVVRLGCYAKTTSPLKLAASKATVEAILSIALVVSLIATSDGATGDGLVGFARDAGLEMSSFLSSLPAGIESGSIPISSLYSSLGAVLWTGWIACAYTIYAQSFGQQRVNATDANLVYSAQPLFTALFAWLLLGETMGPYGVVGGALIGSAVYLVDPRPTHDHLQGPKHKRSLPPIVKP